MKPTTEFFKKSIILKTMKDLDIDEEMFEEVIIIHL